MPGAGQARVAALAAAALVAAFATLTSLVAIDPASPPGLDGIDEAWRDLLVPAPGWADRASEWLRFLGSGIVMVPLRVAVALWLLVRRRRGDLAAWLLAWVLADVVTIAMKPAIGRVRPDLSAATSFPSGHAKTAAQVAVGLALLVDARRARPRPATASAWILAAAWIVAMAISRTVLEEHWLSDVVAGSLLGGACAVGAVALVRRWRGRDRTVRAGGGDQDGGRRNDQDRATGSNPRRA